MNFTRTRLVTDFRNEYIHGDRFVALADWAITDKNPNLPPNGFSRDGIIFCCADHLPRLFSAIRNLPHAFVLISHNSDVNITEECYRSKPANVRHWFAQNVAVDTGGLTALPIGLERQHIVPTRDICETMAAQLNAGRPARQRFCYLNINHHSNSSERRHVLFALFWKFWFVTARIHRVPHPQYIAEIARHRFVISPPGNGLDCHRTWESLYLGSVPIVKRSIVMRAFAPTGLMLVDDLSVLSRRTIKSLAAKLPSQPDLRPLFFTYWKDRIFDTGKRCLESYSPTEREIQT